MLNKDYKDILSALKEEKVKFIFVGAYAMAVYGYPRATMDIDLWVLADLKNAKNVMNALKKFGAPLNDIEPEDFQKEGLIFQIGVAPRRIDIITAVDGLDFESAYKRAKRLEVDGIKIRVLSKNDIIANKLVSGRFKDLADVEVLKKDETV